MDVVNEIFKSIHFDANIYLHSEFCSPWGVESSHPGLSSFHVIAYGNCQLHIEGQTPIFLSAGDLIFFSRNTPHQLLNSEENNDLSPNLISRDNKQEIINYVTLTLKYKEPLKRLFIFIIMVSVYSQPYSLQTFATHASS